MSLMHLLPRAALAAAGVLLLAGSGPARADWQDQAAQAGAEQPADPAWEQYAFDLPYADGSRSLSFEELARSGQPFVIIWWLTECPACHLQLPYVQQLEQQVADYDLDLRVISVCVDQDESDCLAYAEDKGISFTILHDARARKTDDKYHIEELGTPVTYVFDSGGEFVDYLTGFRSEFAKSVYKLLKITPPEGSRQTSR